MTTPSFGDIDQYLEALFVPKARLDATVRQLVGSNRHDGMAIAIVIG